MMLASVTANDISAIAAIMVACAVFGGGIGRKWGTTKKQRAAQQVIEQAAETTVQQLTWAVAGKPKDQWGEREPGIIEQMSKLRDDFRQHVADDLRVMGEFHTRLSVTETSASAAATALAQAAKDTADALAKRVDLRDTTADALARVMERLDAIEHAKAS